MNLIEFAKLYMERNHKERFLSEGEINFLEYINRGGDYPEFTIYTELCSKIFFAYNIEFNIFSSFNKAIDEKNRCQQIIRHGVLLGHHYHTNIDLLDSCIGNIHKQIERINSGDHILFHKYVEDTEFLKDNLLRQYKKDLITYLVNIVNLQHSEN